MDGQRWEAVPSESLGAANEYAQWVAERYVVTAKDDGDDRTADVIGSAFLAGAEHQAARRRPRWEAKARRRGPRPRNKPFDEDEIRMLLELDAVETCSKKRITWNHEFIKRAKKELAEGESPTDIFRRAGVGPEIVGHKRIERCAARWRRQMERERTGNEQA